MWPTAEAVTTQTQYVLLTDANFKNSAYALIVEETGEEKLTSAKKV